MIVVLCRNVETLPSQAYSAAGAPVLGWGSVRTHRLVPQEAMMRHPTDAMEDALC